MTKKSAKGVKGFILWDPRTNRRWFRVYEKMGFAYIDYDLNEEVQVEIISDHYCLVEENGKHRIDFTKMVDQECTQ